MIGSSGVVTNADESPVSTVNAVTAAIEVRLQFEQFRRRLRDNTREANWPARDVVVLEGFQLYGRLR